MFNYFRRAGLLMGRIFRLWEDPAVRVGGGVSWMWNKAAELLWTVWFGSTGLRLSSSWNRGLTAPWAERNPSLTKAWGAGDPFGDHHCGNIVNCVFLRPWEPHKKSNMQARKKGAWLGGGGFVWTAASLHGGWAGDPGLAQDKTCILAW